MNNKFLEDVNSRKLALEQRYEKLIINPPNVNSCCENNDCENNDCENNNCERPPPAPKDLVEYPLLPNGTYVNSKFNNREKINEKNKEKTKEEIGNCIIF